jgi:hypothetical protein
VNPAIAPGAANAQSVLISLKDRVNEELLGFIKP